MRKLGNIVILSIVLIMLGFYTSRLFLPSFPGKLILTGSHQGVIRLDLSTKQVTQISVYNFGVWNPGLGKLIVYEDLRTVKEGYGFLRNYYLVSPETGEHQLLIGEAEDVVLSPDALKLAYVKFHPDMDEDVADQQLFLLDLATGRKVMLSQRPHIYLIAWSPNSQFLLYNEDWKRSYVHDANSAKSIEMQLPVFMATVRPDTVWTPKNTIVYPDDHLSAASQLYTIAPVAKATPQMLIPNFKTDMLNEAPNWSHKGDRAAILRDFDSPDYKSEWQNLYVWDESQQKLETLFEGETNLQVLGNLAWSPDDKYLVYFKEWEDTGACIDIIEVATKHKVECIYNRAWTDILWIE